MTAAPRRYALIAAGRRQRPLRRRRCRSNTRRSRACRVIRTDDSRRSIESIALDAVFVVLARERQALRRADRHRWPASSRCIAADRRAAESVMNGLAVDRQARGGGRLDAGARRRASLRRCDDAAPLAATNSRTSRSAGLLAMPLCRYAEARRGRRRSARGVDRGPDRPVVRADAADVPLRDTAPRAAQSDSARLITDEAQAVEALGVKPRLGTRQPRQHQSRPIPKISRWPKRYWPARARTT